MEANLFAVWVYGRFVNESNLEWQVFRFTKLCIHKYLEWHILRINKNWNDIFIVKYFWDFCLPRCHSKKRMILYKSAQIKLWKFFSTYKMANKWHCTCLPKDLADSEVGLRMLGGFVHSTNLVIIRLFYP